MGLFSGLSKKSEEYQNVGFATATTTCEGEPPLVTAIATPVTAATAASSLPTVAEAINTSKLAASTAAVGATSALSNASLSFGRFPTSITVCPHCHSSQATTRIRTYPTLVTWAVVVGLFLVFWPVCWIPLVIDSCKTTDHYCALCSEHLGSAKPLSDFCVKERG